MKILKLDLLAFGPFTGQSLRFGESAGLHLVFGLNEAGKSSALRALKQLLFGIPRNSTDNFVHAYPDLRIGATLQSSDGVKTTVVRRKATKTALRADDDTTVLDPGQLAQLLGNLDLEAYQQRYGIDYDELVAGGH